jgi:hypothetical protein
MAHDEGKICREAKLPERSLDWEDSLEHPKRSASLGSSQPALGQSRKSGCQSNEGDGETLCERAREQSGMVEGMAGMRRVPGASSHGGPDTNQRLQSRALNASQSNGAHVATGSLKQQKSGVGTAGERAEARSQARTALAQEKFGSRGPR